MDGSFETIEKAAGFHNRVHYRKPSEKDHKSFFDAFSQPAGNLATQRLLLNQVMCTSKMPIGLLITSYGCLS